jgi:hypothetical protein
MFFFGEVHVSLQITWIGIFGANRIYFHLESPCLQEVFFSKTIMILTENNVLLSSASNTDDFLWEIPVFLQLSWIRLFGIKWAFSTFKTVICRSYSFQKLIQLSKGNNVLDATASSIHAFLCRGTCISSTQLNSPNGAKAAYLPHEAPKIQEVSFPKLHSSHKKTVCFYYGWFPSKRYMCFFNLAKQAYLEQGEPPLLWNWVLQGALLSKTNLILKGTHCARCDSF